MEKAPVLAEPIVNATLYKFFWECMRWHLETGPHRGGHQIEDALDEMENKELAALVASYSAALTMPDKWEIEGIRLLPWCCVLPTPYPVYDSICSPLCLAIPLCKESDPPKLERVRDLILEVCEDRELHYVHEWLPLPTDSLEMDDLRLVLRDEGREDAELET